MALALLALAAPLRAQVLTPVYDFALPVGHAYALGLGTNGAELFLFTVDSYYTTPLDVGGSMVFTKGPIDFIDIGIRLSSLSLAVFNPADANKVFFTGGLGANNLLYDFKLSLSPLPPQTNVSLNGFLAAKPTGIAVDDGGAVYLSSAAAGEGIFKLVNSGTGTPVWNSGTSGPGALNAPQALHFGPDGLLYVLDTGDERIVSFDSEGQYVAAFPLANPALPTALAIGADGRLYTMNSAGGGDIYDIYTGAHVGSIADTGDVGVGIGKAALQLAGGYLFATTGDGANVYVYAAPEPTAAVLLIGTGTLALACLRRRKTGGRKPEIFRLRSR